MQLKPVIHPLPGESTVSWCGRLAWCHTRTSVQDFLRIVALSREDVAKATDQGIDRLAHLTGIARTVIEEGSYRSVGDREFVHRSERFGFEFGLRNRTTYCPACLLDDAAPGSPGGGQRIGRVNWMFSPVRTCPVHSTLLIRRANTHYSEQFQDMSLVAPDEAALARQVEKAGTRSVSTLQIYVQRRFDGAMGPAWLDAQMIDQATRSCEMLGACLEYGAHCNLEELTMEQRDVAGANGFAAAANGPDGVYRALEQINRNSRDNVWRGAGPQAGLGRIYQWLQFNKSSRDPGPIRDLVRTFILDTMAIDAGTNLFGEVVSSRRRHSVASLAKKAGVHHKTLNRALVRRELLPDGAENGVDKFGSFDAMAGEMLAERIKHSLPKTQVPKFLNCNRTQAEALVKGGILQRIVPGAGRNDGVLTNVAIDDLKNFLRRFRSCGRRVSAPGEGMWDLITTSEIARVPVIDIVRMVLDGRLGKIETLDAELGFRSVLVDPQEVRNAVAARDSEKGLAAADVADILGIFTSGVTHLHRSQDCDGRPFLAAIPIVNGRGTVRYRFEPEEVARFAASHVKLGDLARERGISARTIRKTLSEAGIEPILDRKLLNAAYYSRDYL